MAKKQTAVAKFLTLIEAADDTSLGVWMELLKREQVKRAGGKPERKPRKKAETPKAEGTAAG